MVKFILNVQFDINAPKNGDVEEAADEYSDDNVLFQAVVVIAETGLGGEATGSHGSRKSASIFDGSWSLFAET